MAKDPASSASSWWGMPRVISSLGLWTTPEEEGDDEGRDSEKENMEDFVERKRRSVRERDLTPFDRKDRSEGLRRSNSGKSRSRSRSRSSSVSSSLVKTPKNDNAEETTQNVTENISKDISNISFSFFNEENKKDLAMLNNRSEDYEGDSISGEKSITNDQTPDETPKKISPPESPTIDSLRSEKDPDESDDLSFSSTFSSLYDKVQKKQQDPVSDVSCANKDAKPELEDQKENQKEKEKENEDASEYSVPKRSSSPIYSSINKDTSDEKETPKPPKPEVPDPDWTPSTTNSSETATDFVHIGKPDGHNYEDIDLNSYCQHRATVKTNMRRLSLLRYRRNRSSMQMRSKVDRFWKYVRKWWVDERAKMNETFGKYRRKSEKRAETGNMVRTGNANRNENECLENDRVEVTSPTKLDAGSVSSQDESFDTFTEDENDKLEVDTHVSLPIDVECFRDYRKSSTTEVPSRPASALSSFKNRSLRSLIIKRGTLRSSSEILKTNSSAVFRKSKLYPEERLFFVLFFKMNAQHKSVQDIRGSRSSVD